MPALPKECFRPVEAPGHPKPSKKPLGLTLLGKGEVDGNVIEGTWECQDFNCVSCVAKICFPSVFVEFFRSLCFY